MTSYSPNCLVGQLPVYGAVTASPYHEVAKPFNASKISKYQLNMSVVFVPANVHDLKRLAGVSTIHDLFIDEEACKKLSVTDRAYLIAFHMLTAKALNLNKGMEPYVDMSSMAMQLAHDPKLRERITTQYFHQYANVHAEGIAPTITSEYYSKIDNCINYVVISPGALTTQFEPGEAPPMDELLATACAQHFTILRECLKPFNTTNSKESIAMCDPSGTFSAYLALLNAS